MRIEVFYRCSWCSWLFRGTFSEEEWERIGRKPRPVVEHHCRGEANRHGVANLVGWKEVEEEEPEGENTNGEVGDSGRDSSEAFENGL